MHLLRESVLHHVRYRMSDIAHQGRALGFLQLGALKDPPHLVYYAVMVSSHVVSGCDPLHNWVSLALLAHTDVPTCQLV